MASLFHFIYNPSFFNADGREKEKINKYHSLLPINGQQKIDTITSTYLLTTTKDSSHSQPTVRKGRREGGDYYRRFSGPSMRAFHGGRGADVMKEQVVEQETGGGGSVL